MDHSDRRGHRAESRTGPPVQEPGNQPVAAPARPPWGESSARAEVGQTLCPNPSAHPVGVRRARRAPPRAEGPEATRHPPVRYCPRGGSGLHALDARERGARHRHRPGSCRPPLPRRRAGVRAVQRREAGAAVAQARPRPPQGRPGPPGPAPGGRSPAGPGLDHPPVRGPGPRGDGPGRRLRRPAEVPLPAVHHVGVQRHAGPALRRLRHRAEVARHPQRRDRQAGRAGRGAREATGRRRRPSTRT